MATEQYHEPTAELASDTRIFARLITGLVEEAAAGMSSAFRLRKTRKLAR
jgi:hypothetical protein